jgi:hypothetical protein
MSNNITKVNKKNEAREEHTLVVFAFRDNYDVYANLMARAIDEYGELDKIVLVNLTDALVNYISQFKRKIFIDYVDGLSKGVYIEVARNTNKTSPHPFNLPNNFNHYARILELLQDGENEADSSTLSFNEVNENLEKIIENYGKNAIYDFTAVPTRMSLQLFFACVAFGIRKIHFFELRRKDLNRTIEARLNNLYHNFPNNQEYFDYKNLTKIPTFQKNLAKLNKQPKYIYLYIFIAAIIISTAAGIYFVLQEERSKIYLIIFQCVSVSMMIYSLWKTWGKT